MNGKPTFVIHVQRGELTRPVRADGSGSSGGRSARPVERTHGHHRLHVRRDRIIGTRWVDHDPELSSGRAIVSGIGIGPDRDSIATKQLIGHDWIWRAVVSERHARNQKPECRRSDDDRVPHPGKATARMSIGCAVIQRAAIVMTTVTNTHGIVAAIR